MLKFEFNIKSMCEYMRVSRSGYYKWNNNKGIKKQYQKDREELCMLVKEYHKKHPSWGYKHINRQMRVDIGWVVSDNLVHKCCKYLNVKSVVRRYKYKKAGEESIKYPNVIKNDWKTSKPLEKVCTDMTCIRYRGRIYDTTLYIDAFNNEILSYGYTSKHNSIAPYYDGLLPYLEQTKRIDYPSTLHSDQGIVYSSMAFTNAHKDYNIIRSMSRVGTPTDNSKIESLNGWIKDEIENDFNINSYKSFEEFIKSYINYYNNERLAYSLNYKTPIQYKSELGF